MEPISWGTRPGLRAASPEKLASMVERELERVDGLLFTATPREDLDLVGRFQQAKDQAFAGQLRAIVASLVRTPVELREFVADEVALALGVSPTSGTLLVDLAGKAGELPGLIEALEHGVFSERHLRLVVDELHQVPLSLEQRQAIVLVLLARFAGETPGELRTLLRKLVLTVDPVAAKKRKQVADRGRRVDVYALPDGQAALHAVGPMEQIAMMRAALDAAKQNAGARADGDDRSAGEREFDLLVDLVTGQVSSSGWHAQVVVPFSTAAGGDLEVAVIPGLGPVLPSTARELLDESLDVTQVAVDAQGRVTHVGDPLKVHVAEPVADRRPEVPQVFRRPVPQTVSFDRLGEVLARMTDPPIDRDLTSGAYAPGKRLRRLVEARDRACVFPGCGRPAARTDKDHRDPWPHGSTSAENLQCLCRRHHRAKQAMFVVELDDEGNTIWITRGGWVFVRRLQGF